MDCSPWRFSIHRILQAGTQKWVAISFSRGSSQHRDQTHISYTGRQTSYRWATREALPKTRASQQESLHFISTWHTQITGFSHSGKAAVPLNLETAFHKNGLLIHSNFKIDTWSCSLKKRAPSTHIAMFGIFKASLTINSKLIVSQQPKLSYNENTSEVYRIKDLTGLQICNEWCLLWSIQLEKNKTKQRPKAAIRSYPSSMSIFQMCLQVLLSFYCYSRLIIPPES